jgi:hypothetical protein
MLLFALIAPAFACVPLDVTEVMNAVGDALDEGRPDAGLDHLTAAWAQLPDACGPASSADLALLAQRAGALAWDLGRTEISDAWYETACTIAPGAAVPAGLGSKAAERAQSACSRVALRKVGEAVMEADVIVDGVSQPDGAHARLVVGSHLLVWQDQGQWRGRWQPISEGTRVGLPSGRAVREPPKLRAPVAVLGAGAAIATAGALVLQFAFADQWNTKCNGNGIDFYADGWRACEEQGLATLSPGYYSGMGLVIGGAAISLTGVGLGIHAFGDRPGVSLTLRW